MGSSDRQGRRQRREDEADRRVGSSAQTTRRKRLLLNGCECIEKTKQIDAYKNRFLVPFTLMQTERYTFMPRL